MKKVEIIRYLNVVLLIVSSALIFSLSVPKLYAQDDYSRLYAESKMCKHGNNAATCKRCKGTTSNSTSTRCRHGNNKNQCTLCNSSQVLRITSVSFGNTDYDGNTLSSVGSPLYSDDMRYLAPVVKYKPVTTSVSKVMYLKFYLPDGTLLSGSSSPSGYSNKYNVTFDSSGEMSLPGYGSSDHSVYPSGYTNVEFWIDGENMFTANVYIQNGSESDNINITEVIYCNHKYDGTKIDNWRAKLYSSKMRYIGAELHYTPLSKSITKTVYVKIYLPDGTLLKGSSSPDGYTTSCTATFDSSGSVVLNGYGNGSKSIFPSGTTRYQVWIDGKNVYSGSFYIY